MSVQTTPNTNIFLLKNIKLDNRYLHTIYFADTSAQYSYFSAADKRLRTLTAGSYQRVNNSTVRVEWNAEELTSCSYLMFSNPTRGGTDKWYYAFVTEVEYINEHCTHIHFQIDVMQTYFVGASLSKCFVERMHVSDDTRYLNLENEPIGSNVWDCEELDIGEAKDWLRIPAVVIATTDTPFSGRYYSQGMFSGVNYKYMKCESVGEAENIAHYIESCLAEDAWGVPVEVETDLETGEETATYKKKAEVLALYTFPFNYVQADTEKRITFTDPFAYQSVTMNNNKMYTSPFYYYLLTDGDGSTLIMKPEYFSGDGGDVSGTHNIMTFGTPHGGGEVVCYPEDYNGQQENLDAKIVINNFPQNICAGDSYKAWLAAGGSYKARLSFDYNHANVMMNAAGAMNSAIQSTVSFGQAAASGEKTFGSTLAGAIAKAGGNFLTSAKQLSVADEMDETLRTKYQYEFNDAHYEPNYTVGSSAPSAMIGYRRKEFRMYLVHVRKDEAVRLDDFLSVYGYAINAVVTPEYHSRSVWNFLQTKGATVTGDMPSSARAAIGAILDGGITFWMNGDNVGNYSNMTGNRAARR